MRQPFLSGSSPEREVHTQHVVPKISSNWTANTPDPQAVVSMGSGKTNILSRLETHRSAQLNQPSRANNIGGGYPRTGQHGGLP